MTFLWWRALSPHGRLLVVTLIAAAIALWALAADSSSPGAPLVRVFEYEWETSQGTYECSTPVTSSRIMRASITIPGGAFCVAKKEEVDNPSEVR